MKLKFIPSTEPKQTQRASVGCVFYECLKSGIFTWSPFVPNILHYPPHALGELSHQVAFWEIHFSFFIKRAFDLED